MYWNQFCYIFFSILRNIGSNRGFPFTQLNRANIQNLEKNNFDMFYKNDCWAVICYPICVTNVSYEREIILLSFTLISFVILVFIFQRFDIKSGFPFYWLTLYTEQRIRVDFGRGAIWQQNWSQCCVYSTSIPRLPFSFGARCRLVQLKNTPSLV